MLADEIGEKAERDDCGEEDYGADRAERGVEPALHRRSDPEILVPAHARGKLHQMAEAEPERERGKHDGNESCSLEQHVIPSLVIARFDRTGYWLPACGGMRNR